MPADFSVVAIVAAYNEADIIEQVILDLIQQGIDVYFLDDGSTDGTVQAVERHLGRGVRKIERLSPSAKDPTTTKFEWERILNRKAALAAELDADWFIHHDADEFRESPWPHLSLKGAIERVDALGFNAIDFSALDFWPDRENGDPPSDVRRAFTRFSESAPYDRVQIRCWKKTADVDLASSGGHEARFDGRKVFPLRFILRHYPIRGQHHGDRKVFLERHNRFLEDERAKGWHIQYEAMREGDSFVRDPAALTPYDPEAVRLDLMLRHRGVEELESALKATDAEVSELRRQIEIARVHIDQVERQLDERSGELAYRTDEVRQLCADVDTLHTSLRARTEDIARLHDELDRRTRDLAQWRAECLAARLASETRGRELDERGAEIARWRSTLDDVTRRLYAVEQSRSWRITAPLRTLSRWLGGRR